MANPSSGVQPTSEVNQSKKEADSETDDDDDDEVIETSPCGRWEKHKKEVRVDGHPESKTNFFIIE